MHFDSHCHLTDQRLLAQLPAVLERAGCAGVGTIMSIAVDLDDTEAILKLTDGTRVWASAGVHPQNALSWNEGSTQRLRQLAAHPHVRAIGETGLDYLYDDTHPQYPGATRGRQEEVFEAQLQVAADLELPVVIHNRDADERLVQIVASWKDRLSAGGVFHCFGSPVDVARRVLDLGFHLGFTGIVTFKNGESVRDVARICPLDRMLIETDAPYLAPVPHRGKTNEPSFVPLVAQTIALVQGGSAEQIAQITTENARRLYQLPLEAG